MKGVPKRLQLVSPSHARSKVQEKETVQRIGGTATPRSGAGHIKADARLKKVVRIEDKTTKHNSFSVTVEHIAKLQNAVAGAEEVPIMKVELAGGAVEFIVIPGLYFEEVVEALKRATENTD